MSANRPLILLFLVCYGFMSNDDYYKPVTLMNVSIYVEKGSPNDVLHVFFIRGELSFTTRSLQYYFFDKLQFTNLRLEAETKTSHVETFEELKTFLSSLITEEGEMKKIREKARLSVQPFIYKFKSKDGNQEREEVDFMKLEIQTVKAIFQKQHAYSGSFVFVGNYFEWEDSQMRVPVAPLSGKNHINIFVNRATDSTTAAIDSGKIITPMTFDILNRDTGHTIPKTEKGKFSKFDFVMKNGVWSHTELVTKGGKTTWELTKLTGSGPDLESKNLLEKHVFFSEGEEATTTPPLFTNFITINFFSKIYNLVKNNDTEKDKFENILYKKSDGKDVVTFDDIKDNPLLEKQMRGRYNVIAELKESFNNNVFHTSVNPFKKTPYEPTTTSTVTSRSSCSSVAKKEGMSGGMIALIVGVVLATLIAIGLFGWYYIVKIKGNASKRNKRLGLKIN
eukprot:GAHX01000405.1.p1 GENE.GAHX01000405.1~~GAHX01000405.1.p1  ORF type:complete len:450 (+),score=71.89 GAHX01000405.1:59-1408(+)